MTVIILLIAAGGTVAAGFLIAFVWAVRSGQFDDIYTPAVRVLFDLTDPEPHTPGRSLDPAPRIPDPTPRIPDPGSRTSDPDITL